MQSSTSYNEKALLRQVAEGDEQAFANLFHAWRDKLYFFLLRITNSPETAEDLVQDVFVKLWLNRASRGEVTHFSAWLYRVNLKMFLQIKMIEKQNISMNAIRIITINENSPFKRLQKH